MAVRDLRADLRAGEEEDWEWEKKERKREGSSRSDDGVVEEEEVVGADA